MTIDLGVLDAFESGRAYPVGVPGRRLVLVRLDDQVYVLSDRCSHEDFPLSEGEVDVVDRTIECARHGATFALDTGEPQSLPATHPVERWDVVVEEGRVKVVGQ